MLPLSCQLALGQGLTEKPCEVERTDPSQDQRDSVLSEYDLPKKTNKPKVDSLTGATHRFSN
jgi:hypothetical protein